MKAVTTGVKKETPKNGTQKVSQVQKIEKSSTKVDDVLQPTAESRLKKLATFQILADKHKFVNQKNDDLQKFIASSDGTKEKVILKNSQGFELEVSNSSVIENVIFVIKEELQRITDHSEKQVLEFSI